MDARELGEWRAFARLEPYALDADRRIAMLCALVGNVNGGKKDGGAFAEDDFVPNLDAPEADPQDVDEQVRMARLITEAMGGAVPPARPAGTE